MAFNSKPERTTTGKINTSGINTSGMNYKFQPEHMNGINTSGMGQVRFGTVATVMNAIQDAKLRIENDPSRSPSEKKALIRKLLDESQPKLNGALDKFRAEVAVNMAGRMIETRQKARGHKSLTEQLQLLAALKGAMPNGADIKSLVMGSPELAAMAASLPDEVLKANGLSSAFADMALKQHYPEIAEADAEFEANNEELQRLAGIASDVLADVEARALGKDAAEKRVDEDNLLQLGGE